MNISDPNFFMTLKQRLMEDDDEISIDAFMCLDWNTNYDLGNPENFSDPDNLEEWDDNSKCFQYFNPPFADNTITNIFSFLENGAYDFAPFQQIIANVSELEGNLLGLFETYTFGNGYNNHRAYAAAEHYEYAKIEIERLHDRALTNHEFLKRNLRLDCIMINDQKQSAVGLDFKCGWDLEHGLQILVCNGKDCRIAE